MEIKKVENKTLLVKHLPTCFSEDECNDFFKHLGAVNTKYMGQKGSMKNTAFVTFPSTKEACNILNKLHQLSFLGTVLAVEYSKSQDLDDVKNENVYSPLKEAGSIIDQPKHQANTEQDKQEIKLKYAQHLNSISSAWNFEYEFKNDLYYSYPSPTMSILINITNALASVPKFYIQVLHLMNKMNLPAPFGPVTLTPPVPDDTCQHVEQSSESEIESDDEKSKNRKCVKRKTDIGDIDDSLRKKLKLQIGMQAQLQANLMSSKSNTSNCNPTEVFDHHETSDKVKKFEFKLSSTVTKDNHETPSEPNIVQNVQDTGGFGKIEPVKKQSVQDTPTENDVEWGDQEFMSKEEMIKNKLTIEEQEKLNLFKNYEMGESTSRLYIKNLAKSVTEDDLHFVFGRYVNWKSDEKSKYNILLMKQGRMKGQAFITLPSESSAKKAIKDANALVLHGKPMVVHFARTAK